jgi:hypothetical protein
MNLRHALAISLLATASTAGFADTVSSPIDLSMGNASFGRNNAVGSFVDRYSFTLAGSSWFLTSSASSSASGAQDLDFTSLTIVDAADVVVATFVGNLGNDANEFYAMPQTAMAAGAYQLVITGTNTATQASYSGTIAISPVPVPEPATGALVVAGLGVIGFMSRRLRSI